MKRKRGAFIMQDELVKKQKCAGTNSYNSVKDIVDEQ